MGPCLVQSSPTIGPPISSTASGIHNCTSCPCHASPWYTYVYRAPGDVYRDQALIVSTAKRNTLYYSVLLTLFTACILLAFCAATFGASALLLRYIGKARTRCHSSVFTSIRCGTHPWPAAAADAAAAPSSRVAPPDLSSCLCNNRRFAFRDLVRNRAAMDATVSSSSSLMARAAATCVGERPRSISIGRAA